MSDAAAVTGLRVLVANERQERLDRLSRIVAAAGHRVTARLIETSHVSAAVDEVDPDLAIVALGERTDHALELVGQIVDDASCPVIVVLEESDAEFVARAARLGVFGHLTDADPEELQSAIEIVLRRFTDIEGLRAAFARRVVVERAKGVLMERHAIGEREAFNRLRDAARSRRVAVAIEATDILDGLAAGTSRPA